jgi:hypothetical protein
MTALPSNIIHLGAHRTQISCGSEMSLPSRSLGMRDKKDQAPIQLADHRRSSPIDERPNSPPLSSAGLFTLDDEPTLVREFAACTFAVFVLTSPAILFCAAVVFYSLMVA